MMVAGGRIGGRTEQLRREIADALARGDSPIATTPSGFVSGQAWLNARTLEDHNHGQLGAHGHDDRGRARPA